MARTDSCFRRLPAQVWVDGGALRLLVPGSPAALRMDDRARRIWELLEYPASLDELVGKLAAEYAGDPQAIRADVTECIAALCDKGAAAACAPPTAAERQRSRYLGLLKRSLVNLTYPEHELRIRHLLGALDDPGRSGADGLERIRLLRDIRYRQPEAYRALADAKQDCSSGLLARVPFCYPHTLLGLSGLDSLEHAAEAVFAEGIPGDFLEAGACQGGASIFLRALQVAHGQEDRRMWVADSFEGLPEAHHAADLALSLDLSEAAMPKVAFGLEGVRDNFRRYDLLDERVRFVKGWFADTLGTTATGPLAILRMDGDLYASTTEILEALYDRVSPGGFVIEDDYGSWPSSRKAVDDFRAARDIREPLHHVDRAVVYWRKG
jgi:O-methyltransferase